MRAKLIYEKFEQESDPIKDMNIGIPEHVYIKMDWSDSPGSVTEKYDEALVKIGIYVYELKDEKHQFHHILTKRPVTNKELKRIIKYNDENES